MRVFNVSIDGKLFLNCSGVKPLRVVFNTKRTLSESWSFLDLSIYNLSEDTNINVGSKIVVAAGYDDNAGEIFQGTVISSLKEKQGVDTLRRVICRTLSYDARNKSYISVSYGKNTDILTVLQGIADAWDKKLNIDKDAFKNSQLFVRGFVADGDIPAILNALSQMYNFLWSEDLATLYIRKIDAKALGTPIKIDMFNGLIGIPQATHDNLNVFAEFDCALNPKININSIIELKSEYVSFSTETMYIKAPAHEGDVSGLYWVNAVVHTGDNYSATWRTHVKGQRIG